VATRALFETNDPKTLSKWQEDKDEVHIFRQLTRRQEQDKNNNFN
jgi:hypothetical protein